MGSLGEDSDEELATEETEEEVRGRKKKIFRPRLNRNTIMELSIHNRRLFFLCLLVVEAFGISAVILTVHWAINIKGGVGYVENMGIPFNWHPILMTLSLIFLYGNGALIYRVIPPRNDAHKLKLKLAHAGIMIVAFALMVIGLQAAFGSPALRMPMGSRLCRVPFSQVLARDQSTHPSIPSVFWFCHPRPGRGRRLHGPPREDDLVKHGRVRGEGHGGPDREHDRPLPCPLRHGGHLPPEQVLHRPQAWSCLEIISIVPNQLSIRASNILCPINHPKK